MKPDRLAVATRLRCNGQRPEPSVNSTGRSPALWTEQIIPDVTTLDPASIEAIKGGQND